MRLRNRVQLVCVAIALALVSTLATEASAAEVPPRPELARFLREHPEFGTFESASRQPDWARGAREELALSNGTFLVYYEKGRVVTLVKYERNGERKDVWRAPPTAAPAKEPTKAAAAALPSFTVLERITTNDGGVTGDILVPSISRSTKKSRQAEIAAAIAKSESLTAVNLFCSADGQKAAYSESFAKAHPAARRCILGALIDGKFIEPD